MCPPPETGELDAVARDQVQRIIATCRGTGSSICRSSGQTVKVKTCRVGSPVYWNRPSGRRCIRSGESPCSAVQHLIHRSLGWLGTAALALATVPAVAEPAKVVQGKAAELGVMSVSLKDAVKLNYGLQGQLQGAGTPNERGIGGFIPLRVGTQSVTFLDVLANVSFADYPGYSSIINTTVAGGTISTSTRLGQRWLNGERSWMYGVNFGYDSRPMATGPADTGVNVSNLQTVFFQQLALNAEAVSDRWSSLGYWQMPIGQYGWGQNKSARLNSVYVGGPFNTIGGDIA